jgi:hypothetical protein
MFRPNWPASGVQVVEEIAAPLSHCCTLYFKGVKYLQNIWKLFLKYRTLNILLCALVVGLVYL